MKRITHIKTRKGSIEIPFFMPDATRASVRGLTNNQILSSNISEIVVNTYHLMLRPGAEFLRNAGGIHKFMNWDGSILTDSGGYQVYSLIHKNSELGLVTEDGAKFRSVLDGRWHYLTPEKAIEIQFDIGSDMMVVLDDPRPPEVTLQIQKEAVERTIRWAKRCKIEFDKQVKKRGLEESKPLLFAVVQGGKHVHLRKYCAEELKKIGFDGYGFGGRHVDENGLFMDEIIESTAEAIPQDKPRFALGIGNPSDIVKCYFYGWDMFDCVIPSREGRHGRIFLWNRLDEIKQKGIKFFVENNDYKGFYKTINISNAKFKQDFTPFSQKCECYACKNYTKSYINHLFGVKESLGAQMATIHNLKFYSELMEILRLENRL